jgi:hypothetical protein
LLGTPAKLASPHWQGRATNRRGEQPDEAKTPTYYYAGIDVAKKGPLGRGAPAERGMNVQATNDERGIRSVVRRLLKENVTLAVLEATGGL